MNKDNCYNTQKSSLAERETYNNAILLLSMIKSEYYYIIGFSRSDNMIELGFDFTGEFYGEISETMKMHFSDEEYILIRGTIHNLDPQGSYEKILNAYDGTGEIVNVDNKYIYELKIKKDRLFPLKAEYIHEQIIVAKNDIIKFLELCYKEEFRNKDTNE